MTSELVFIIDRSGSMQGLEHSTISGFNEMINRQKTLPGQAFITTILFDDKIEVLYQSKPIEEVEPLSDNEYYVRGCTALLDTVGLAITNMIEKQKKEKSDHVIFVITTDGYENFSKEYTYKQINSLINHQQDYYDWEFIFLGARIEPQKEAAKLGIKTENTTKFYEDSLGVEMSFEAINTYVKNARLNQCNDNWDDCVKQDMMNRKKTRI